MKVRLGSVIHSCIFTGDSGVLDLSESLFGFPYFVHWINFVNIFNNIIVKKNINHTILLFFIFTYPQSGGPHLL